VTYRDLGTGSFTIEYVTGRGTATTPAISLEGSGEDRTATFVVPDAAFDGSLADGTDFLIRAADEDVELRFVRVVRLEPPT
jgi:hypothetical protein